MIQLFLAGMEGQVPIGRHPYLDSLMELDDNSGQVVQAIRDLGITEDTLVIWTTDNGAWVDAWPDAGYTPFRGVKRGAAYEGGFRVPAIAWWAGHDRPRGERRPMNVTHMDWWPTFAGLIGVDAPPHIWRKDNDGKPIVFDGINSAYLLGGQGPSGLETPSSITTTRPSAGCGSTTTSSCSLPRTHGWGQVLPLTSAPAMYNLFWDPGEQFDSLLQRRHADRRRLRDHRRAATRARIMAGSASTSTR